MGNAIEKALLNWRELNDFLKEATEEQTKKALEAERAGAKRLNFLLRCHSRLNLLRGRREVAELRKIGLMAR